MSRPKNNKKLHPWRTPRLVDVVEPIEILDTEDELDYLPIMPNDVIVAQYDAVHSQTCMEEDYG